MKEIWTPSAGIIGCCASKPPNLLHLGRHAREKGRNAHGEQGQYPQGPVVTLFVRHHTCEVSKEM